MELSLFSRDVIAMSTAVGLSHNVYDGALFLGVCDKIVPGLVMGALSYGHLPIFLCLRVQWNPVFHEQKARERPLLKERLDETSCYRQKNLPIIVQAPAHFMVQTLTKC